MAASASEVAIILRAQDQFSTVVAKAKGDLAGLGPAASTAQAGMSSLGSAMATVSAAVGAFAIGGLVTGFASAVSAAAGFESKMSAVGAVAGASASEMAQLQSAALALGAATSFSASEAASGLEELIKAGVSVGDALGGGAAAALNLAAAGGVAVADAAEIASNAMNIFNKSGAEMGGVADTIAGAANASAISVNDFKFSLAAVGAVAATAGLSFEDTAVAIAELGNSGIKGADAGTSLKAFIAGLTPSSKSATAAMRELGLITADGGNQFFDAGGKMKSMSEIQQLLQDATKGLTNQQRLMALETIFGSDAIRAASVLASEGAEGFTELSQAIGKVSAQQVADERLNNLSGSLEKLKGSLETAAIGIGLVLTPGLKTLVDEATTHVNLAIGIIDKLPDAWRTVGEVFAGAWEPSAAIDPFVNAVGMAAVTLRDTLMPVVATVGPALQTAFAWFQENGEAVIGALVGIGTALAALAASQAVIAIVTGIGVAIAALTSPIGLVIAASALLGAAWATDFGGVATATTQAWAAIQPTLVALVDWLGVQIPPVLEWLASTGWPTMVAAGQTVGTWITSELIPALTTAVQWLGENLPPVITWISEVGWPGLVSAGTAVASFVTDTLIPGVTDLVDWLGPKLEPVVAWLTSTGWPGLVAAGDKVGVMVGAVITFFQDLYVELEKRGVFTELEEIWKTLTTTGDLVWEMLTTLAGWFTKANDAMLPVKESVGELVAATMLPALAKHFEAVGSGAQKTIEPVNLIAGAIKFAVDQVSRGLQPLRDFVAAMDALSKIKLPEFKLPSIPSIGSLLSLPGGGGGTSGSDEEKIHRIGQVGLQSGLDPEGAAVLQAVGRTEGGLQGAVGDSGNSFGPFQFHTGGQLPAFARWGGWSMEEAKQRANDIDLATQFAATNYLGNTIKQGQQAGFHGPALATYAQEKGQVSINPWKAGQNYVPPSNLGPTGTPGRMDKTLPGDWGDDWLSGEADPSTQPGWVQQLLASVPQVQAAYETITTGAQEMGTATAQSFSLMGQGSLTAVTDLGSGVLTTTTDMAGNTIATVTGMGGEILNQYATLANGAQVNIQDLATRSTATMNEAGTAITRVVSDAAGNVITTTTDLNGKVVEQFVTMGTGMAQAQAATAAVLTGANTSLGTQLVSDTTNALGMTTERYREMNGDVVSIVTDQNGKVVADFTTSAGQVGAAATGLGTKLVGTTTDSMGRTVEVYAEANGDIVQIVTDASGAVVDEITDSATKSVGATEEMQNGIVAATELMSTDTIAAAEELNTGVVSELETARDDSVAAADEMEGGVTAAAELMQTDTTTAAEEMNTAAVGEVQTMAIDGVTAAGEMQTGVTAAADLMNTETVAAAQAMHTTAGGEIAAFSSEGVTKFGELGTGAGEAGTAMTAINEITLTAPDVSEVIDAMKEVEQAADRAAEEVAKVGSGDGEGGGGDDEDDDDEDGEGSGDSVRSSIRAFVGAVNDLYDARPGDPGFNVGPGGPKGPEIPGFQAPPGGQKGGKPTPVNPFPGKIVDPPVKTPPAPPAPPAPPRVPRPEVDWADVKEWMREAARTSTIASDTMTRAARAIGDAVPKMAVAVNHAAAAMESSARSLDRVANTLGRGGAQSTADDLGVLPWNRTLPTDSDLRDGLGLATLLVNAFDAVGVEITDSINLARLNLHEDIQHAADDVIVTVRAGDYWILDGLEHLGDRIESRFERLEGKINDAGNTYALNIETSAPHEPIVRDFAILESLARSGT